MMINKFSLQGKTAIITGAAGLLGKEHSNALLELGANVVMTDINPELLAAESTEKIFRCYMDVTSLDSIKNALDQVINKYGQVDILINNAAIDSKVGKSSSLIKKSDQKLNNAFENFSLVNWDNEIKVGLTGAFLCSQIIGGWMAQHQGGVILNISSDLSVISPDQRLYQDSVKPVTYSVIKTALIGLTRYLATYWAEQNIRVNALSPGGVQVEQGEEFISRVSKLIPLKRMANKSEYQGAIQFLCSAASSYLTGHNLVIDGGRSVW